MESFTVERLSGGQEARENQLTFPENIYEFLPARIEVQNKIWADIANSVRDYKEYGLLARILDKKCQLEEEGEMETAEAIQKLLKERNQAKQQGLEVRKEQIMDQLGSMISHT